MNFETTKRGSYYETRKSYVEGLMIALAPMQDFNSIDYARSYSTDEEFTRITDTIGGCVFLDITALSRAEILKEVARIILCDELMGQYSPKHIIHDTDKKRKIAPLFKA